MARSRKTSSGFAGRTVVLLMATAAALLLLAGVLTYQHYEGQVRSDIGAQLEAVASLKVGELAQWRRERSADARFFSENRAFAVLASRVLRDGDPETAAEIHEWFDKMRAGDRYEWIALLDVNGVVRVETPEGDDAPHESHGEAARRSHATGEIEWVDFHRNQPADPVHLTLLAPVSGADGAPLATVSLRVDPRVYLYPFIQRWPAPTATAETFIARREGDEMVYLNPLRFDPDAALNRRSPVTRTDVPSVRGALGQFGFHEGLDYRDAPVVAAVRPVPSSPWILVARLDPEEAWAPIRERLWQTVIIGLLCFVAVGAGLTSLWQRSRVEMSAALQDSERRYRDLSAANATALERLESLVEASPTILYTLDMDGPPYRATWVSDNITRILGYTVEDALAPGWWSANVHPDDHDRMQAEQSLLALQREHTHEYRFRDARGQYHVIRDELRTATDAEGRPHEIVGARTDVTEQRASEARQRLQLSVLEAAANAIIVTSADGVIEWANPAFATLTGYTLAESIGHTPGELLHSGKHDPAFYRAMWDTVKAGHVWQGELVNKRKDGTLYDEEMTITPVRDETGAIAHFVAIKQSIADRKHLQEQFLQAQRMESVGRLAGGVAHDFNNLLTVINSYAELAIDDLADDHPLRPSLIEIHKAGERAAGLTRQLLAFSRKQVLQPRKVDLNLVVANMEKMLRRLLGEDVDLEVRADPDPTMVRADPGQIEQVLMNLSVNARDAMPTGGTLMVETRRVQVNERLSAEHAGLIPGAWIMMTVKDTGAGMSAETRARAFEPFFTTKPIGQGTGLGLPTVFGIVQQSGGMIWVDSAPGEGTQFTICLPDIGGVAPEPADLAPPSLVRGTEVVLIVEDDDMLRELTKHVLSVSGYDAYTAGSGDNALLLLEQLGRPVDLVLTDVVMPGMTGRELDERVRARWPGTKILFMSGYTDDMIVRHGVMGGRTRLLNKPFTRAQVLRTVREVLDER